MQGDRHKELSEDELLARHRSTGDNRWLGILLQRYTLLLLGVAMKYLKDKPLAEDAVQQVFLKALTNLPKEEILNFKGWLYILMRNHCFQYLRDRHHVTEIGQDRLPDEEYDKEAEEWRESSLEQMNSAMRELAPEQKLTVEMFYLKKMSYQQITEQTGFSYMQVKSYIQNGKRNLKHILLKKIGGKK